MTPNPIVMGISFTVTAYILQQQSQQSIQSSQTTKDSKPGSQHLLSEEGANEIHDEGVKQCSLTSISSKHEKSGGTQCPLSVIHTSGMQRISCPCRERMFNTVFDQMSLTSLVIHDGGANDTGLDLGGNGQYTISRSSGGKIRNLPVICYNCQVIGKCLSEAFGQRREQLWKEARRRTMNSQNAT